MDDLENTEEASRPHCKILSSSELMASRKNTMQVVPETGARLFQPDGSWLEEKQLQAALDERFAALGEERQERLGSLSQAEWDTEKNLACVTKPLGKHWSHVGHIINRKTYLMPEEALYLLECSALELKLCSVPVSIQQAYSLLLGKTTGCSREKYHVYTDLSRCGYIVIPHDPETDATRYERQIRLDQHLKRKRKNLESKSQQTEKQSNREEIILVEEKKSSGDIEVVFESHKKVPKSCFSTDTDQCHNIEVIDIENEGCVKSENVLDCKEELSECSSTNLFKRDNIQPEVVEVENDERMRLLNMIPDIHKKKRIRVKVAPQQYLPLNISTRKSVYYIELTKLYAAGEGGKERDDYVPANQMMAEKLRQERKFHHGRQKFHPYQRQESGYRRNETSRSRGGWHRRNISKWHNRPFSGQRGWYRNPWRRKSRGGRWNHPPTNHNFRQRQKFFSVSNNFGGFPPFPTNRGQEGKLFPSQDVPPWTGGGSFSGDQRWNPGQNSEFMSPWSPWSNNTDRPSFRSNNEPSPWLGIDSTYRSHSDMDFDIWGSGVTDQQSAWENVTPVPTAEWRQQMLESMNNNWRQNNSPSPNQKRPRCPSPPPHLYHGNLSPPPEAPNLLFSQTVSNTFPSNANNKFDGSSSSSNSGRPQQSSGFLITPPDMNPPELSEEQNPDSGLDGEVQQSVIDLSGSSELAAKVESGNVDVQEKDSSNVRIPLGESADSDGSENIHPEMRAMDTQSRSESSFLSLEVQEKNVVSRNGADDLSGGDLCDVKDNNMSAHVAVVTTGSGHDGSAQEKPNSSNISSTIKHDDSTRSSNREIISKEKVKEDSARRTTYQPFTLNEDIPPPPRISAPLPQTFTPEVYENRRVPLSRPPQAVFAGKLPSEFQRFRHKYYRRKRWRTESASEEPYQSSIAKINVPVSSWTEWKEVVFFEEGGLGPLWQGEVKPLVQPHDASTTGSLLKKLQIVGSDNSVMDDLDTPLEIGFDVYLPKSKFNKSSFCVPDYRVVIVRNTGELPHPGDLKRLKLKFRDKSEVLVAVVGTPDISYFLWNNVCLPEDITLG